MAAEADFTAGEAVTELFPEKRLDVENAVGAQNAPPRHFWDYSTVTDLARLRGWSTSQPLLTAM
jgi:hypothetical protein